MSQVHPPRIAHPPPRVVHPPKKKKCRHGWSGHGSSRRCRKCGFHPPHISESFPSTVVKT